MQPWFKLVHRLQRRLGKALETLVLALMWVLAVLPRAYLQRPASVGREGWIDISGKANPNHRQFVADQRRAALKHGRLRALAAVVGAMALLIAADTAAGSLYFRATAEPALADRAESAAYDEVPWAREYWRDFPDASTWEYEPYVGWLRDDMQTEYISVVDGSRATWTSPQLAQDPVEVWLFGGSTMWGLGQRDEFTIPSALAKEADRAGLDVLVRNYGTGAHRLWQENLHLESRLLQGGEPDLVIFYDGANEPTRYGTHDSQAPTHSRVEAFKAQLEVTESVPRAAFEEWKDRSLTLGVARRMRSAVWPSSRPALAAVRNQVDAATAVENIFGVYAEGVAIGRDIGNRHDFPVVHLWQPTLYTKTEDPAESDAWSTRGYRLRDRDWYEAVYEMARDRLPDGVIDLSDSLDDAPEPVFFDHTHTNELGAKIVAQQIFSVIEPTLRDLATRPGS